MPTTRDILTHKPTFLSHYRYAHIKIAGGEEEEEEKKQEKDLEERRGGKKEGEYLVLS